MAGRPSLDDYDRRPQPARAGAGGSMLEGEVIAAGGCWCGGALGHDWPGKGRGAPHPRPRPGGVMTPREGELTDRLARGEAVPGGPGACARDDCAHALVRHSRHGRKRCERCPCPGFERQAGGTP
jgi:hypothetical protein